jgi:eukaryotic-like serine/threonine-protein kinase
VEWLLASNADWADDWTPDGRFVLATLLRTRPDAAGIWLLSLDEPRQQPRRWMEWVDGRQLAVSPDGSWLAYTGSESGQENVFVQRFDSDSPPARDKVQISLGGGSQPVWRADGKELFFLSRDNTLMAVAVRPGVAIVTERPVALFNTGVRSLRGPCRDYDTRDGQRFLLRAPVQTAPVPPLELVVNWHSLLSE